MTDLARIGFAADTSGLTKAQRELGNLANKGEQTERKLDKSIKNTNQSFMSLKSSVGIVGTALAALGSARLSQDLVKYSDTWKGVNSQIRQVTGSEKELLAVRQMVVNTAKETRSDLEATTKLYTALDRATTHLGVSTEKQIELTKTINNLFLSGGKSAEEASGAIRQLTQGLESGALRGDEFNSVAENAPRILDALASSLGMARGELREFAATGGITAEILVKALGDYNDEAQKLADQTEKTFGQNMEIATTNLTSFVGELDSVNSIIGSVGGGIVELTDDLDDFSVVMSAWSKQFSVIGKDIDGTMSSTSKTFRLEMIAMGAITDETLNFLTGAVKHFPSNLRAIGQIIATELYSAVDISAAAGKAIVSAIGVQLGLLVDITKIRVKAFGNVLGTELAALVKKAEIYGRQIRDAMNPFDGDAFDHEEALANAELVAQEMTNTYLKQADEQVRIFQNAADDVNKINFDAAARQIEASRIARLAIITDTLAVRSESIKTFEDLLAAVNKSLGAIPKISKEASSSVEKTLEKASKKTDEWGEITERAADRIDQAFADVWLSIGDGFDSVTDSLIDGFKRTLAEMAHAAITKPIVMQVTAAMGLGGMSGAANAGGILSGAASGVSGMSGLGLAGVLGGGIIGAGTGIASLGGALGLSSLGSFGAGFASTGAALATPGVSMLGNVGAMFSGGGFAAGLGALVPIVAGIAGIAGIADKLTGGGLFGTSYKATGQSLTLGTSGGDVSGFTTLNEKKKKSFFRGTKRRTTNTDFDTSAIESIFSDLELSILDAAEKLDISEVTKTITHSFSRDFRDGALISEALTSTVTMPVEEWLDKFSSVLNIDTKDLSEEEVQAKINEWVQQTTDSMVDGVFGDFLSKVQKEGESSADALNRALISMDAMTLIADTIGVSFDLTGQEAAIAATNIAELAGGLDNLTGLTSQYYNAFFSEQEKFDNLASDLGDAFSELGEPLPQTRDAFRALVEGLDLTTEEGQAMFATLMQLVPGMDAYLTALESQGEVVQSLEESLSSAYNELEKAIDAEKLLAAARMESSVVAAQAEIDALNLRRDALDSQKQLLDDNLAFAESELAKTFSAEKELARQRSEVAIIAINDQIAALNLQKTTLNEQKSLLERNLSDSQNNLKKSFNNEKSLIKDSLKEKIESIKSSADIEKALINDAMSAKIESLNAEKDLISSTSSDNISALNNQRSALESSITSLISLSERMNESAGVAVSVEDALLAARKGNFALAEKLNVSAVGSGGFSSAEEMAFAQARQNAQLREIGGLASSRASAQERIASGIDRQIASQESSANRNIAAIEAQIEAERVLAESSILALNESTESQILALNENADNQLAALEDQLNSTLGVDTSIMSMADAIADYQQSQLDLDNLNYESQIAAIDEQIALAQEQIAITQQSYNDEIEALDNQLNAIMGIDTSIMSMSDAIALYQQAQLDLDELNYDSQVAAIDEQISLAQDQIEIARQQYQDEIARLDAILEDSESQINALLGIDTSVMSVENAINNLYSALVGGENGDSGGSNTNSGGDYIAPTDIGKDGYNPPKNVTPPPEDPVIPFVNKWGVGVQPGEWDKNPSKDQEVAEAIKASTRANAETADILQKIYRGEINVRVVNP